MDGLAFLLSIIATGLVIWWVIQNDSAGIGDATTGLLAMRRFGPKSQDPGNSKAPTPLARRTPTAPQQNPRATRPITPGRT
jgi:hypothetical protein